MACSPSTCGDRCYEAITGPTTGHDLANEYVAITGQELVAEYAAALDRIADQAADRAAVVRTRIATLEAELVALDGLATQLGETT